MDDRDRRSRESCLGSLGCPQEFLEGSWMERFEKQIFLRGGNRCLRSIGRGGCKRCGAEGGVERLEPGATSRSGLMHSRPFILSVRISHLRKWRDLVEEEKERPCKNVLSRGLTSKVGVILNVRSQAASPIPPPPHDNKGH